MNLIDHVPEIRPPCGAAERAIRELEMLGAAFYHRMLDCLIAQDCACSSFALTMRAPTRRHAPSGSCRPQRRPRGRRRPSHAGTRGRRARYPSRFDSLDAEPAEAVGVRECAHFDVIRDDEAAVGLAHHGGRKSARWPSGSRVLPVERRIAQVRDEHEVVLALALIDDLQTARYRASGAPPSWP